MLGSQFSVSNITGVFYNSYPARHIELMTTKYNI